MKAHQLNGVCNTAIRLAKVKVPGFKAGHYNCSATEFPAEKLMMTRCTAQGEYVSISYFYKGTNRDATIPNDFKITRLNKKEAVILEKEYREYVIQNLSGNLYHSFKVGSDPEIFVEDESGNIIPAFNFLGSKEKPNIGPDKEYCRNAIYWDGFQAEFTTHADTCLAWQVDSTQGGLKGLLEAAKRFNKGAKLSSKTLVEVDHDSRMNAAEEHVSFGCMPSYNVYNLKGRQLHGREVPVRSAGGHIHLGIGKKDPKTIDNIVKALDAILGVACVSLFAKFDDPRRRQYYGLPGEYRLPPHGLEYRVLSNAWLVHPLIMNMVFDLARKVTMFGEKGLLPFWEGSEAETIDVIINCDVEKAREILKRNKDILMKILGAAYHNNMPSLAYKIFLNGLESAVADPNDIAKNWNLEGTWKTHSDGIGKNWKFSVELLREGKVS